MFIIGENTSTNIDPGMTMFYAVDFSAIIKTNMLGSSLLGQLMNHCLGKQSSENIASDFEVADLEGVDFNSMVNNL